MLELYHNPLSTCSQKVRLVLDEKELAFHSHEVDLLAGAQHDPDYVKLNPNHVVPTLVDGGAVLIESTLIGEYLDDAYPERPMRPADPVARQRMRLWTKRIDEKVHPAAPVVTYAIGPRNLILAQPEEAREAYLANIPDPVARAERRSVIEHGVDAPEFAVGLRAMVALLDDIDAAIEPGTWLSGDSFGLADAAALPYVLRLDTLGMPSLVSPEARPRLADWYARVKARPSYASAVTAWVPEGIYDMLRGFGEALWPQIETMLAADCSS